MGNVLKRTSVKVIPYNQNEFFVGNTYKNSDKTPIAHGEGKYVDELENVYMGEFKNHKFEGKGTMLYNTYFYLDENNEPLEVDYRLLPVMYEGEWKGGFRHGSGKSMLLDGSIYEGKFNYDEIHGRGKLTYNNGDYYIGDFNCGIQYGKGTLYASNHIKMYEGEWMDNCFHGKGSYYYPNGNIHYEGNWYNSLAHGIGILYSENSEILFYGRFENGEEYESFMGKDNSWKITLTSIVKESNMKSPVIKKLIDQPETPPLIKEAFEIDKPINKNKKEFIPIQIEEKEINSPKPVSKESIINPLAIASKNKFINEFNNPLKQSGKIKLNPLNNINIVKKAVTPPKVPIKKSNQIKSKSKVIQINPMNEIHRKNTSELKRMIIQ